MSIAGGISWIEIDVIVAEVSDVYRILFCCYIAMMLLGVLNIITGIFVTSSHELMQLDRDLVTQMEMEKHNTWMRELTGLFKELDENGNGYITLEEFIGHATKEDVQAFFGALQLDVTKAVELFELLDVDGSFQLEIDEFVVGCMRLKGMAKSIDLETVLAEHRKVVKRWTKHFQNLELNTRKIMSQIVCLCSHSSRQIA